VTWYYNQYPTHGPPARSPSQLLSRHTSSAFTRSCGCIVSDPFVLPCQPDNVLAVSLFVNNAVLQWVCEGASGKRRTGGITKLRLASSTWSVPSSAFLKTLCCTCSHLSCKYCDHLGATTTTVSKTIGSMSMDTPTNAAPEVAAGVTLNSTPSAGSKRKFDDEDVCTNDFDNNWFGQSPRPLKKARSPTYTISSERVRKPGDSILGKRQREDLVTNDSGNEGSDQTAHPLKKARSTVRCLRAADDTVLDNRQRQDIPWDDLSHVPAPQREQIRTIPDGVVRGIEHLKGESDAIYKLEREVEKTEDKRDAFIKMALGLEDSAPRVASPVNNDPHRAYRPVWQHGRPARNLFFVRRGDVDRLDQKSVNRRVNFKGDDKVRDPSVYRNPLTNTHASLRQLKEQRGRQRTAADIAEYEADLAAIRKAQEEVQVEGLTPTQATTKAVAVKDLEENPEIAKEQERKDASVPKNPKTNKKQQNKENKTLAKDKKVQRAERAQKKKAWKEKIAAWSTAA